MGKDAAAKGGTNVNTAELQLLIACRHIQVRRRKPIERPAVSEVISHLFEGEASDVESAYASLAKRGLIEQGSIDGSLALTAEGLLLSKALQTERDQRGFGEWLTKAEGSQAFAEFCKRVYGTPFVQFGMVDAEQLEALLGFLDLKASDRVVDLGCGIGSQAEHIADRTGAHVLGVDFAEAAIGRAKERTKSRRDRLEFALGDLDDIKLPPRSFNAVVALDSLYFVDDLEKVTADIVNLVAPGGRLAVFYSQIKREDPSEVLEAGGTRFAMALKKLGVAFETRDFTENEFRHWQKELAADAELKPAYEDEGNIDLWASSDEEARQMLDVFKKAEASRYLYMARL